jgi:hypothetical protein
MVARSRSLAFAVAMNCEEIRLIAGFHPKSTDLIIVPYQTIKPLGVAA